MTIRPAQPGDAEGVLRLAKEFATSFVVEEAAFRTTFTAVLSDPSARICVAEHSGNVVGYLLGFEHFTFFANGRIAWVEELMVRRSCRRRGVGRGLMDAFNGWAVTRGCRMIALATRRASAFYEATGYQASATYFRKLLGPSGNA